MRKLLLVVAFAASFGSIDTARTESYPSRPITIVVPYAAGGPADVLARILAEQMGATLGQPVIIENVTGAGGSIGVGRVARAAPDGYTVSIGNWTSHVVNGAVYALHYDLLKDLEPVALLPSNPYIIASKLGVPANDLKELIAWLKANPDKASAGTAGAGSGQHLTGLYFQTATATRFQFVPYRGGASQLMQDVIAGHIDLSFDQAIFGVPHAKSGKIRAYAVTAETRLRTAPEIPTVDEAGVPGLHVSTWFGLWVPQNTPKDVITKLNAAVVAALAHTTVRQRLTDLGQEIPRREQQTPEALGALQKAEIKKWWPIIRRRT